MMRLLVALFVWLVWSAPVYAFTWEHGNTCTMSSQTSPTTADCTITTNVTAGRILVGGVGWTSIGRTIGTLTTTLGNTCTLYNNPTSTSGRRAALFACIITNGGTETLHFGTDSTGTTLYVAVDEYSGQASSTPVDSTVMNPENTPGTATDGANSTTLTPGQNDSLIYGYSCACTSASVSLAAGTGFTVRQSATASSIRWASESLVQGTAASIETTFTVGGDNQTITGMIIVKPTAGVGDPTFGFYRRRPS